MKLFDWKESWNVLQYNRVGCRKLDLTPPSDPPIWKFYLLLLRQFWQSRWETKKIFRSLIVNGANDKLCLCSWWVLKDTLDLNFPPLFLKVGTLSKPIIQPIRLKVCMVFHGFWLVSMVFQGSFMDFGWFPWFFKLVSWFIMDFGWFPWFC